MRVWVYSPSTISTRAFVSLIRSLQFEPCSQEAGAEVALWDLTTVSCFPTAPALPTLAIIARSEGSALDLLQKRYRGYLTDDDDLGELELALKAVRRGEIWAPRTVLTRVIDDSLTTDLTAREKQIRDLIVEGLSNRTIAKRLNIAEPTVKTHVSSILTKYNVPSRAKVIAQHTGQHV